MTTINYAAALPVLKRARTHIANGHNMTSAIGIATYTFSARDRATAVLSEIAGCPIEAWNDAPGRTQAEVLALFDRAIAECESQVSMTAREGE